MIQPATHVKHAKHPYATGLRNVYTAFVAFLDAHVFPLLVAYVTHPLVILATLLLLAVLVVWATNTTLVLLSNSYLNVASAAVSSIVLATSLKHHSENKRMHAKHADELQALHAKIDAMSPQTTTLPPVTPTAQIRGAGGRFVSAKKAV